MVLPYLIFFLSPTAGSAVNALNGAKKHGSISEQLKPLHWDSNKTCNCLLSAWKNSFIVYWTSEILLQLWLFSSKVSVLFYPHLTLWKDFVNGKDRSTRISMPGEDENIWWLFSLHRRKILALNYQSTIFLCQNNKLMEMGKSNRVSRDPEEVEKKRETWLNFICLHSQTVA